MGGGGCVAGGGGGHQGGNLRFHLREVLTVCLPEDLYCWFWFLPRMGSKWVKKTADSNRTTTTSEKIMASKQKH